MWPRTELSFTPVGQATPVRIRCTHHVQRNWSRVGIARFVDESGDHPGEMVFLKQFFGTDGSWHPELMEYERQGTLVAGAALGDRVVTPEVLFVDESRLLMGFRYCNVVSTDVLLRRDPVEFGEAVRPVLDTAVELLEAMRQPPAAAVDSLAVKPRPYGGAPNALNFKGFDIRNLGVLNSGAVMIFDLGRPYLAPIEEAAAKMLVSIGLLNWGRPVMRFIRGPDVRMLATAIELLGPYLDRDAIEAEIELQHSYRLGEPKAPNSFARGLKGLGIALLGGRYLDRMEEQIRKLAFGTA